MSDPILSAPRVRAVVERAVSRWRPGLAVAVRGSGYSGAELLEVDGTAWRVVGCRSSLAVREALVIHKDVRLVVVVDRPDDDLGLDVLARLVGRRVLSADPWDTVRSVFSASELDPALVTYPALAKALADAAPASGYPPVRARVLDRDTAWATYGRFGLGIDIDGLEGLLAWSASSASDRWLAVDAELREGFGAWVAATLGGVASLVLAAVESGHGGGAGTTVAIGLVSRILFDTGAGPGARRGTEATGSTAAAAVARAGAVVAGAGSVRASRSGGGPSASSRSEQRDALIRLEPWLGGCSLSAEQARQWVDAAERLVRSEHPRARVWLERADAVLVELRVDQLAAGSDVLALAWPARLEAFARSVTAALGDAGGGAGGGGPDDGRGGGRGGGGDAGGPDGGRGGHVDRGALVAIASCCEAVRLHDRAGTEPAVTGAVVMAARLVRRLVIDGVGVHGRRVSGSFAGAAAEYVSDGGFVDRAREALVGVHGPADLLDALRLVAERVDEVRETQNRRFADLLAGWTTTAGTASARTEVHVVGIEEVLDRVVAPLAGACERGVLVVVADALSQAVFRELLDDLTRRGWIELGPDPGGLPAVIAVVPSVTEMSRTSLLSGRLCTGAQAEERAGFAGHPGLVAVSRAGRPPELFHKDSLGGSGGIGLGVSVAGAIASPEVRVVGVVVNTVDDHLLKGDQLRPRWTLESVRPLGALLDAARDAGRIVVLTADHGHVLERGTEMRSGVRGAGGAGAAGGIGGVSAAGIESSDGSGGERWRTSGVGQRGAGPGEVVLAGARVLAGGGRVIAPWTDRLRYSPAKRNGYHGGASTQEMIVPLAVLSAGGQVPDGWVEVVGARPAWWEADPTASATDSPGSAGVVQVSGSGRSISHAAASVEVTVAAGTPGDATALLAPATPVAPVAPAGVPAWIDALIATPLYEIQRSRGARSDPGEARMRALLGVLDQRGGVMTEDAIARAVGIPAVRVNGFLTAAARVLNVDGYQVLESSEGTVRLNIALCRSQFGIRD